jgi:DNA-binding response OmpR family regulator
MPRSHKILLVDQDEILLKRLADRLSAGGSYAVTAVATVQQAELLLATKDAGFDAVILEDTLPDGDGRELCLRVRSKGRRLPIIILSSSTNETEMIKAFDAGANDHLIKPFRLNVLLARLRAHLRIFEHSGEAVLRIGPYEFHPATRRLHHRDRRHLRIPITETESRVLKFLYSAGRTVTSRELTVEVLNWNEDAVTHSVGSHIYRIRQKIEPEAKEHRLLLTDGHGWRLYPEGFQFDQPIPRYA